MHSPRNRLLIGLFLAALAVPTLDSAAVALTPAEKYARSAFKATNANRAENGISKVDPHRCMRRMAVAHARRMADREEMYHQDLVAVLIRCELSTVGENVAAGFKSGRATVNRGWMRSPEHRINILNPVFQRMGLGARKGDNGKWYVCQLLGRNA